QTSKISLLLLKNAKERINIQGKSRISSSFPSLPFSLQSLNVNSTSNKKMNLFDSTLLKYLDITADNNNNNINYEDQLIGEENARVLITMSQSLKQGKKINKGIKFNNI